jgi:hypothetical protein
MCQVVNWWIQQFCKRITFYPISINKMFACKFKILLGSHQ